MNSHQSKKNNSLLGNIPEAQLHTKILDLVNSRINPYRKDLEYDKGICKSCVSKSGEGEKEKEAKKNSVKKVLSKQVETPKRPATARNQKKTIRTSAKKEDEALISLTRPQHTLNLIRIRGQKLNIFSEVLSLSIEGGSLGRQSKYVQTDFTEPDSIEKNQIHQLKIDILDRQTRIKQLEEQLRLNKDYITELNKDIEGIRALATHKAYSDNHLCNNEALSEVSIEAPSLKEAIMSSYELHEPQEHMDLLPALDDIGWNQENMIAGEHLLRIICTQAKQLQKLKIQLGFLKGGSSFRLS